MSTLTYLSDQELVPLLQAGDHGAFAELYNRYKGELIIHAYKKLGNFEDAKEIVQEMFSGLWSNHRQLPAINNCAAYLYTLVRNKVLNFIEHQQVEARYAASFLQHINEAHNITDIQLRERELQRIIDKEIAALPPKMREVFLLSRKEYLSHKEIAIRLNISEHTVKNHIKAALKTLRQSLGFTVLVALHYLI